MSLNNDSNKEHIRRKERCHPVKNPLGLDKGVRAKVRRCHPIKKPLELRLVEFNGLATRIFDCSLPKGQVFSAMSFSHFWTNVNIENNPMLGPFFR